MTTMDWQSRLNAALSWIEDHLTEDWSWDEAAAQANCSVFHFLRMFEVVTGVTAGEYLRRRRLSEAARALAAIGAAAGPGEASVADIGAKYGYESADAFSRAFRRLYDMSPSEARRPGARLAAYNPLAVVLSLKGSEPIAYRLEGQGPGLIAGFGLRVPAATEDSFRRVPPFWKQLEEDGRLAALASLAPAGQGLVAALTDHDEAREDFLYVVGVLLSSGPGAERDRTTPTSSVLPAAPCEPLPAGMLRLDLPALTWAVFEVDGPFPSAMQELWPRVWSEWFAQSGMEAAEAPRLEIYPPGDRLAADYRSEIRVPLAGIAPGKA